jgi:acetate kinase
MWIACVPLYGGYMMESRAVRRVTMMEGLISPDGVRVRAFVIPTDEERLIARDTADCLS